MTEASDTAFVLRTWPLREADLIVSAFTLEHGKVRGVAHSATRPKSRWLGALDALTEVELCWRSKEGQELLSLTECSIVRSPYVRKLDLAATWTLAHVAELIDESAPAHDADETLYRLVRACVDALVTGTTPGVVARYASAWVLRLHGVLPDSNACAACGRELTAEGGSWRWSLHGLACPACAARGGEAGPALLPEDLAFLEDVRRLGPADVTAPSPGALRRTGVFLRQVLREFLGKELKSERFLEELDRMERQP